MDRKAWIAVTLSVIGLVLYQWQAIKQQQAWAAQQKLAAHAAPATSTPVPSPSAMVAAPSGSPSSLAPVTERPFAEDNHPVETKKLRTAVAEYTFTSAGGIQQIELLTHKAENGKNVVINSTGSIPIGAWTGDTSHWLTPGFFTAVTPTSVTIEAQTASGLKISKTFTVGPVDPLKDEYQIKLDLSLSNPGPAKLDVPPWFLATGSAAPIHRNDQATYTNYDYQAQSKTVYVNVLGHFDPSRIPLIGIEVSPGHSEYRQPEPDILWAGTKDQYFATILQPLGDEKGHTAWATRYEIPGETPDAPKHYGIDGALGFNALALNPGETRSESFAIYTGPKEYSRLKKLGTEQEEVMQFGFFKVVSGVLLNSLNLLHSLLHSYAAAIIVLTLIIKTGLWTIQNKSMQSMKKMSLLAPKMAELKEKYKDDPTRMNQEVMKLYKDYGINPFAGCLPLFIQMPIFWGFYSMLAVAVELRNSGFLWIKDLSQPDTLTHLAGFPVNVLPLIMAGSMLWQMQLTPKTGDTAQQRMFLFMPVIFLIFCYNYASALALYWTVQNIFSIVQLYLTRNQPLPQLVKVNAIPTGAKSVKRVKRVK